MKRTALAKVSKRKPLGTTGRGTVTYDRLRTKAQWRARLDDLFRAILMIRNGVVRMPNADGRGFHWHGRCSKCGAERTLYASHIEPKGQFPGLRWDERNAIPLCFRCHIHWWHKNPREANEFARVLLGAAIRDSLARDARWYGRAPIRDFALVEYRLVATLWNLAPAGVEGIEW